MTTASIITPDFNGIPEPLRPLRQWVVFSTKPRRTKDGRTKLDKIPHQPRNGRLASTTDSRTWGTFKQAVTAYRRQRNRTWAGIGFVFTKDDPYYGVDLDGVINPETGAIEPWAIDVIERLDTYWEPSISGSGLHAVGYGDLPEGGGKKKGQVEMYSTGRFFTMTGRPLDGCTEIRVDCSNTVATMHAELIGTKPKPAPIATPPPDLTLDDHEVLRKARAAANGPLFVALFDRGDTSGHGDDDSSADLALANLLRFWTGADPHQMDRLFRQSALARPKWDQKRGELTYGQKTITLALPGDTYAPSAGVIFPSPEPMAARSGHGESDARSEVIAVQAARIAELEAIVATQHTVITGAVAILEADMTTEAKVIQMALAFRQHHGFTSKQPAVDEETGEVDELTTFFTHQGRESERLHVSADAIQTVMDAATVTGAAFTKVSDYCKVNPWTNEPLDQPHRYVGYRPVHDELGDTLHAIAANVPETLRRKKRCTRTRPEPAAAPTPSPAPVCDDHPGADLSKRGEHAIVSRCATCGLATQAVLIRDHAVLRPITAASGRGPLPHPSVEEVVLQRVVAVVGRGEGEPPPDRPPNGHAGGPYVNRWVDEMNGGVT